MNQIYSKDQNTKKIFFSFLLFCFAALSANAQHGPFGIGNSDGSNGQPKLLLWLDGSSPTVIPDSDVLIWPDMSGNGNDFTAVAATSPVLKNGVAANNFRRYLEFSKEDNRLTLANLTFANQGVSIFYVFRTGDVNYGMFSFAQSDANPKKVLAQQVSGTTRLTVDGTEHITSIGNLSNNVWRYAGYVWDGVSNPTYWHRSNGNNAPELTENNVMPGLTSASTGTAVIGHIQNLLNDGFVSAESFQGELAEIIVYDGVVNRAHLRQINTYFRNKYNVGGTGAWDKLQSPASHREGLIGIARDNGSNSEQLHSRRDGLVLRTNPGGLQGAHSYLSGGHTGGANSVVTSNLPAGVEARWARDWYMRKDGMANNSDIQIAFDFGEGINGDFPFNESGYVLLYRTGTTGNYAQRAVTETYIQDKEVVFRLSGGQIANGYYTLGTLDNINSNLTGQTIRTWHAYQSGTWNNPDTWTLDGSAAPSYVNSASEIPSNGDAIVISSGRTVTMNVNNRVQSSLTIRGVLDIASTSGHNFSVISGNGTIRCAGASGNSNFPLGNTAPFADALTGGQVEFYGTGFTQTQNLELNRFRINLNNSAATIIMAANLTHNGFFEINQGTFQVNNTAGVSRNIESFDDVLVESAGRITVSATNRSHVWTFHKNFSNEGGDVRFTNRTAPAYTAAENQGHVFTRFVSATENQSLIANGISYFTRIVINKGNNSTYVLTISSDGPNKFGLFGSCNSNMGESSYHAEGSGAQATSVSLINGTLEIRENIFLPLQTGANNFNINETATLWVNGGFAAKGAPDVGTGNAVAIVPYGSIRVSAGTLNANCNSGITTRGNGVVQVDGGELNANQIRTSVFGSTNVGGVIINGGVINVDGTKPGGVNGSFYTFSLTYPGNIFRMTGGELRVAGPSALGLIFINSNPEETSVSGGTVIAEVKNTSTNHRLTSRAAFWNLEIVRSETSATNRPIFVTGGSSGNSPFTEVVPDQRLLVRNSLRITGANNATLRMRSATNQDIDAHIRGNFIVENGGIYDHQANTTHFDGGSSSILSLPTTGAQTFNNVVVNKNADTRFAEIQTGNGTLAMEVLGDFNVERGYFNNGTRHIGIHGNVVNRNAFGTDLATGVVTMMGSSEQQILSDNGIFHNLTINNANGVRLTNGDLRVRRTMRLLTGNFYLGQYKLRVESGFGVINVASPSASRCFVTNGQPSAGGLEIIFRTSTQLTTYPLGVEEGLNVKYTPAVTRINGNFDDEGFVRIVPVNSSLPTVGKDAAVDILNFYWKVAHSEFTTIPRVSHQFQYNTADVTGNANNFASGRVLFDSTFDRGIDSLNNSTDHVNTSNRWIFFNGDDVAQNSAGNGRPLTNAAYTAVNRQALSGRPKVYYSRSTALNADFNTASNWTELSQFGPNPSVFDLHTGLPGNTDFPKAGDIAFIGFNPANGKPHSYEASAAGVTASEVRFTPLQSITGAKLPRYYSAASTDITVLRPTFSFSSTAQIENISAIIGEGTILLRDNIDLGKVDLGEFLREDSSIVMVQSGSAILELNHLPASVPNFFFTTTNNGSHANGIRIATNLSVRGDFEIAGNAKLNLSTGVSGDLRIGRHLKLGKYQAVTSAPEVRFGNIGRERTVAVLGDLIITGNGARIQVQNPNATPQLMHNLVVSQNILQNAPASTGLNLFSNATNDFVILTLTGDGNHEFFNQAGNAPQLGRLILDKGANRNHGFAFNSLINVGAPSDGDEKAIQLRNGLLTINHASTNITLSSGGENFVIPATTGLVLGNGTLRINGNQVGMNLSGLLKIDAGLFEIGNAAGQNNYIEYSSGGGASIEISGGQLNVGSQIRRGLTNTQGVLDYRQSGGIVRVGVHDAPSTSRGVFEVINAGSRFDFTSGQLILARGVNSTATASLLLQPTQSNIDGNAELIIGTANSPAGAQIKNIGINSTIAIPALIINNASGNGPVVSLYTSPLTIVDLLDISGGSTFDTRFLDLTLQGDVVNDGLLKSDKGKVTLDHSSLNTISGSGVFDLNFLSKIGGGVTTSSTSLLVKADFTMDEGVLSMGANTLTVQRNISVDGDIEFTTGEGLILNGSSGAQTLRRSGPGSSKIDILTTDNPQGINQLSGQGHVFEIGKALRMKRGIFNLNGNLMELSAATTIDQINAFGQNNMISTGGSFTNFGVRKHLAANTKLDVFMPLGLDKYMPIRLIFSDVNYSSGTTPSSYLFKLNQPSHPVVLDPNNVLQMYFSIEATGVGSNLRMDMELNYDESFVSVTNPNSEAEYIGARIVDATPSPNVFKFLDAVNPVARILSFSFNNVTSDGISGDYFGGMEAAIPNNVPVYTTTRNGSVNEGDPTGTYDQEVPGGGAPNGAVVRVVSNHVLNMNINGVVLYKTIIEDNATLEINATTFHRLGIVEGTGTIRLVNTGSLPSGIYNQFFTCEGGRLQYAGTSNFEVLSGIPVVREVTITGSGNRNLANNDVFICDNLNVDGPNFLNSNIVSVEVGGNLNITSGTYNNNQGALTVEGDVLVSGTGIFTTGNQGRRVLKGNILQSGGTVNMGTGGSTELFGDYIKTAGALTSPTSGSAKFMFRGSDEQIVRGDFAGANAFRIMEINNSAGVRLHNNVDVSLRLELTSGNFHTGVDSLIRFANTNVTAVPAAGTPNSFISGPMEWVNLNTAANRIFPIGRNQYHRPLTLTNRSATRTWTVEYFDTTATMNPTIANLDPIDPFMIKTVSKQEYWRVNSNSASPTTARVGLSWGDRSAVADDPADQDKLVVLHWDNSNTIWQTAGANSATFSFDPLNNSGSFVSQTIVSFSERFFTLGSTDAINPLPVTFLHFAGSTDGNHHTLSWATGSEVNNDYFELQRSVDGRFFVPIATIEGAGNSNTRLDYTFVDRMAPDGRVYYRLRQIDFNGDFEYAEEVVTLVKNVSNVKEPLDFLLFPNPTAQGDVRLMINDFEAEMVVISISDLSGKVLSRKAVWIDEQGVSEHISCNFGAGVYVVSVIHNETMRSKPLVVTQ